jgi:hypothetical protein
MAIHPRPRAIRAALGLAAAIALLGGLLAAVPNAVTAEPSRSATPLRFAPVVATADLLVYAEAHSASPIRPTILRKDDVLHVVTASGAHHNLGAIGLGGSVAALGPLLEVYNSSSAGLYLRWWNYATHRHGARYLPADEEIIGPAPNGWLFVQLEGDVHILRQTFGGKVTDLGDPLTPDVAYGVVTGSTGLVAYSSDSGVGDGELTFVPWKHPSHRRALHPAGKEGYFCGSLSSRFLSCYGLLFPLSGARPTVTKSRCLSRSVVFKASEVWIERPDGPCHAGAIASLGRNGRLHLSTRRYGTESVVAGIGRIVLSNRGQSKLLALTSPDGRPKVLAR